MVQVVEVVEVGFVDKVGAEARDGVPGHKRNAESHLSELNFLRKCLHTACEFEVHHRHLRDQIMNVESAIEIIILNVENG